MGKSSLYEEHFLREHTFCRQATADGEELVRPDLPSPAATSTASSALTPLSPATTNGLELAKTVESSVSLSLASAFEPLFMESEGLKAETVQLLPSSASADNVLHECQPCELLFAEKKGLDEHKAAKHDEGSL